MRLDPSLAVALYKLVPGHDLQLFIYFLAGHKLIGLLKPTIKRWYGFLNFCDETHYDFMAQRGLYGLSLLPRSYC